MRAFSHLLMLLLLATTGYTQNEFWKTIEKHELQSKQLKKERTLPVRFKSFELTQPAALKTKLAEAPLRFSAEANRSSVIINIPMPDGSFQEFNVFESPLMPLELAEKFPQIKTYTATGITNPNAVAKIDFTHKGFHAMILAVGQNPVFVDPFNVEDQTYISYFKKDFKSDGDHFECGVSDSGEENIYDPNQIVSPRQAGDCQFREYRLALACTGEYAQYHDDGDIVNDAMAAMTTTMNRVNGVFETDAGLTMVFVPNNEDLIFTNPSTDPYSNGNGGAMLNQNQTTCNAVIGSANYDIGHVFSTGGGGVAYLSSTCNNSHKAKGVTGQNTPEGDPFDIDYVSHEMGHQFGANHTQNNSCNRNNSTAFEPGSASTIMGYAGICNPNVQNNSDAYFHAISVLEMGNFTTGSGNSCANIINTSNNQPSANAGSNYTIPVSTPFVLTGIGTDPDNDDLTYCWEQWDNEIASMPPSPTNTVGPAFRSFYPTENPQRYFPRLSVLAGPGTDTWEVLPSVSRNMDFRLTVRDNNNAYGCTDEDNMTVTTTASSGPFTVIYPNAQMDWVVNTSETILWDVANTTAAPVSCNNVDIFYSTDGGLSFPYTLVTDVANDGAHTITVPDISTTQFRIMVKCSDNIFFDISNENVNIGVLTLCETFHSTDVPVIILPLGVQTVTSDLTIALGENITDINVLNLEGTHTWIGDLKITLISPDATEVILVDQECGNNDNFDVNFDDDGATLDCPYNDDQTAAPEGSLSDFNGSNPDGTWVLEIMDMAHLNGGQLLSWSIEVCYDEPLGPLPLDLLHFEATAQKEEILLSWRTANEVNNRGFEIHKSTDPQTGFDNIGWVNGLGNAIEGNYHFEDKNVKPGITYYYRLKQIDFDQKFTFSGIKQAKVEADDLEVGLAPNPASDLLAVSLMKDGHHSGEIQVIDVLGKKLSSMSFEMKDRTKINLDLNDLTPGVYFLDITLDDNEKSVRKFIKK